MTHLVQQILEAGDESAADLFACTPVPTLLLGANGAVVRANPAAEALFLRGPGTLAGESAAVLLPGLWEGASRTSIELGDGSEPRRVAARRADGAPFAVRLRSATLPAGGAARFIATVEDLTAEEQAVAAAAAQVTAANREFESFVDAAAHDLRSPLRILTDFAGALDDECGATLGEDGRGFLKEIVTASARMEGIVDGLLSLARSARAEMACERLDLTTLVDLVCYELRHSDSTRSVECEVEPGMVAWGDVRLVMTVLRNLIGNAWKFTARTAQPRVRIYTERRNGRAWICVSDNGAGFDMAHAARLFQPFTRLHRQDEFPGHGIGLATVKRIVQRHGGEIEAQSETGGGTTLRFWLRPEP